MFLGGQDCFKGLLMALALIKDHGSDAFFPSAQMCSSMTAFDMNQYLDDVCFAIATWFSQPVRIPLAYR
jgi:hypothetical protein